MNSPLKQSARNAIFPFHSRSVTVQGISLPEVLISIAIIVVLAAFGIPAIGKMKERANFTKCLANLRQIGVGYSLYLTDNNQYFPPYYAVPVPSRTDAIMPYLDLTNRPQNEGVFACPSAQPVLAKAYPTNPWMRYSYHQNRRWASSVSSRNHSLSFQNSKKAVLVYEQWGAPDQTPTTPNTHAEGRNILYVDMHVESRKDLISPAALENALRSY